MKPRRELEVEVILWGKDGDIRGSMRISLTARTSTIDKAVRGFLWATHGQMEILRGEAALQRGYFFVDRDALSEAIANQEPIPETAPSVLPRQTRVVAWGASLCRWVWSILRG
jgi:hypothetical protein